MEFLHPKTFSDDSENFLNCFLLLLLLLVDAAFIFWRCWCVFCYCFLTNNSNVMKRVFLSFNLSYFLRLAHSLWVRFCVCFNIDSEMRIR